MTPRYILCFALFVVGCAALRGKPGSGAEFSGSECDEVRQTQAETIATNGFQPRDDTHNLKPVQNDRQRVLLAICPELATTLRDPSGARDATRWHKFEEPSMKELHQSFELRRADPIVAGSIVLEAARLRPSKEDVDRASTAELTAGIGLVYADLIQPQQLEQALNATQLPDQALGAYRSALTKAKQVLDSRAAAMGATKRSVMVDGPRQLVKELLQEFANNADFSKRLDGLLVKAKAGGDWRPAAADLNTFRQDLLKKCGGAESCTFHPLYVEATHALAVLYIAQGVKELARAESSVLSRENALKNQFQAALYRKTYDAAAKSNEAYSRKHDAQKLDAKVAAALGEPVSFFDVEFFVADSSMPFLAAALEKSSWQGAVTEGIVAGKISRGGDVQLEFKTEFVDVDQPYDCVRTNRVTRINRDGSVDYETNCKYKKEREALPKPSPVVVDADETKAIKAGDWVSFWRGDERGAIVFVRSEKGKVLAQVRGDRLKPGAR